MYRPLQCFRVNCQVIVGSAETDEAVRRGGNDWWRNRNIAAVSPRQSRRSDDASEIFSWASKDKSMQSGWFDTIYIWSVITGFCRNRFSLLFGGQTLLLLGKATGKYSSAIQPGYFTIPPKGLSCSNWQRLESNLMTGRSAASRRLFQKVLSGFDLFSAAAFVSSSFDVYKVQTDPSGSTWRHAESNGLVQCEVQNCRWINYFGVIIN